MFDSLQPHGLWHARLPCPSLSPGVCLNSCLLSWWCHPTISSSVIPFSCPQSFPASGSFLMSQLFASGGHSIGTSTFSISLSNEYLGSIFFRIHWFDLAVLRYSSESYPMPQFESIRSSMFSLLYGPTLTSIHDYWKNPSPWGSFAGKVISLLSNMLSRFAHFSSKEQVSFNFMAAVTIHSDFFGAQKSKLCQ